MSAEMKRIPTVGQEQLVESHVANATEYRITWEEQRCNIKIHCCDEMAMGLIYVTQKTAAEQSAAEKASKFVCNESITLLWTFHANCITIIAHL